MNPILVDVYRENVLESFHRGVICLVDAENKVIFSAGDIQQICYPRSALKYFQHIPLITSGAFDHFGFTLEELAVMCGSHNGEVEHLRVVDSILNKIGLKRENLNCGAQYPTLKKDVVDLYIHQQAPQHIHNNCSGKHAGFLAMSVYLGENPNDYWKPEHPVQQKIKEVVADFHEYPTSQMVTAFDGCSAPIFSIPVYNQAIAYKNLTLPKYTEEVNKATRLIIQAVASFPYMVAGKDRYCTEMMEICGSRIIGKTGAEGIFSLSFLNEKLGCTIKIDDGKMLPQYHVAQYIINQTKMFSAEELEPLQKWVETPIKNFNKLTTGSIVARELQELKNCF